MFTTLKKTKSRNRSLGAQSTLDTKTCNNSNYILNLHSTLGNRTMHRLIASRQLQTKLTVGRPDDIYEQEADRVADRVMKMPDSSAPIKRMCTECEDEIREKPLGSIQGITRVMTKGLYGSGCDSAPSLGEEDEMLINTKPGSGNSGEVTFNLQRRLTNTAGKGVPLTDDIRSYMEPRFGYNFKDVKVHTDDEAVQMTNELGAHAFTTGKNIYFNSGKYNPATHDGKQLLAHELTHVIQQQKINKKDDLIQGYSLKGFPPKKEARMRDAMSAAERLVSNCDYLTMFGKFVILRALRRLRYDYVPNLGLCGWTFPGSWYVEIGEKAFDPNVCCYLSSTLAHEASHTELYTEGMARKMECKCFLCC